MQKVNVCVMNRTTLDACVGASWTAQHCMFVLVRHGPHNTACLCWCVMDRTTLDACVGASWTARHWMLVLVRHGPHDTGCLCC